MISFLPRQILPTLPPRILLRGSLPTRPPRPRKRGLPGVRLRTPARGAVTTLTALVPQERQALHRPPSPQLIRSKRQPPPRPRQAGTSGPATTSTSTSLGRQAPGRQSKERSLTKTLLPLLGLRLLMSQAPAAINLKKRSSSRR